MKTKNRIIKKATPKKAAPKVTSTASAVTVEKTKSKFIFCTSCGVRLTDMNHLPPYDGVCAACKTAQGQKEAEAARRKQSQFVAGVKHTTYVKKALKAISPWLN